MAQTVPPGDVVIRQDPERCGGYVVGVAGDFSSVLCDDYAKALALSRELANQHRVKVWLVDANGALFSVVQIGEWEFTSPAARPGEPSRS